MEISSLTQHEPPKSTGPHPGHYSGSLRHPTGKRVRTCVLAVPTSFTRQKLIEKPHLYYSSLMFRWMLLVRNYKRGYIGFARLHTPKKMHTMFIMPGISVLFHLRGTAFHLCQIILIQRENLFFLHF